ncbi:response regulator [Bacillus horti]|uniref:Two-component SAPR family response regulator n=1 Tax=Caldalkalibacillus horti TaxID=77523 RepID=A0ABT9VV71_9BACI|nr:response regulator [Bacillus horti]MDQ0164889.1 two-component SAPR family response regulator [Bacillus horti]
MKVILVDDERPALLQLERLLKMDGRMQVDGKYTSAQAGLDHVKKEPVDIVFLDIDMPEMNGLEAAEHFQQANQELRIIFVTAYSNFALEAFELFALDYLLKPILPARLTKTVDRVVEYSGFKGRNERQDEPQESEPLIQCFKRFVLQVNDGTIKELKWRTLKTKELFAYLLHHNGKWLSKDHLVETIWPDYPMDKAVVHLHTSIYQIRKMLKEWNGEAKVEFAQDSYRILQDKLTTDVFQFEQGLGHLIIDTEQNWEVGQQKLALYTGDYLEECDYPWAEAKRSELQQSFFALSLDMAKYELQAMRGKQALHRLKAVHGVDPYSEECCRLMLEAYAANQEYIQLRQYYDEFKARLQEDLGVEPEQITETTYEWLLQR